MRTLPALLLLATMASPALAAPGQRLIPDYGRYQIITDPFEKPDPALRYKIVFDVGAGARNPAEVHQGLERVARMANLLSINGVDVQPGDLVVAVHGMAARALLNNEAHTRRFAGAANPNVGLLSQLAKAGISVRVCGQTMEGRGFARTELHPDVHVDVSAITTIASYQLRGYALLAD